jgi:hypothetical protein
MSARLVGQAARFALAKGAHLCARWKNLVAYSTPKYRSKANLISCELRCCCVWMEYEFRNFFDLTCARNVSFERFCIGFLGLVPFRLDVFWELDSSSTMEDMVSDSTSLMKYLALGKVLLSIYVFLVNMFEQQPFNLLPISNCFTRTWCSVWSYQKCNASSVTYKRASY